jgi:CRISPR system Cascade subunit CasB
MISLRCRYFIVCSAGEPNVVGKAGLSTANLLSPCITHIAEDVAARALAKGKGVSEKRLFQVVRSDEPNDMIQLRRILQMAEPSVNWPRRQKQLWYWNARSKRDLLEEYFINQPK